MNWLEIAQNLPTGGKARSKCPAECGSGTTLSITHDNKRYWCNCFRCGYSRSHDKGIQTLADLQRIRELNEAASAVKFDVELPEDFTTDIPLQGRLWLYEAGLHEGIWKKKGFGYSKELERVILPVYDGDDLVWFQGRAILKGQAPKYLQPSADRSKIMFKGHSRPNQYNHAVVVEDILSATRVGKHIDAYSLLGTKITTGQAAELSKYKLVTTWLDPDKAGKDGAYNIRRVLGLVTNVNNIVTDEDPKKLSDISIFKELVQCLHNKMH